MVRAAIDSEDAVKRKDVLFLVLLAITALILALAESRLQAAGHGTLKVTATYTGRGAVDPQHKIYVLLMDANPFTSTALVDATSQPFPPPAEANVAHVLAVQGTTETNGTVTFHDVLVSTVYVIVLFDKKGEYNGHVGSFSQGEPMGIYGTPPDKLDAITVGPKKPAQITLTFDDSRTTP